MNSRNPAIIALATILITSAAPAAEVVWPTNSAGDFSIAVALQRFRIYADHCSAQVPPLKPKFESLMEALNSRIQGISKDLLASDAFKGMKDKLVPAEIVFAFKDSFDDARHNFERQDAASACPKTLQNLAATDDDSLKSGLREILVAVQNMIQKSGNERAR
jgi:hypothetical protein